jgi:hypothetical protein
MSSAKDRLKAEKKRRELAVKYKSVFGTEEGKAVLIDILSDCHVMGITDTLNTNEMILATGKRNAGLEIARKAFFDLDKFTIAVGGERL